MPNIYHEDIRTKSQEEGGCHWKVFVSLPWQGMATEVGDSRRRLIMELASVRLGVANHNLESSRWIWSSFKGILPLRVRWKNARASFRNWLYVPFQSHWHFLIFPIWEAAWNKDLLTPLSVLFMYRICPSMPPYSRFCVSYQQGSGIIFFVVLTALLPPGSQLCYFQGDLGVLPSSKISN